MVSELFILWFYDEKWKVFDVETFNELKQFDTKAQAEEWMKAQEVQ